MPTTDDQDGIDRLIDPDQTRMLITIAETRSFSRAATALGVSQPAVSQAVKRLEQAAGRRLFRRTGFGVELTGAGEAVMIYARAMRTLADGLRRHFDGSEGEIAIRVGMAEDFCRTALPSTLSLFARVHGGVQIKLMSGTYEMLNGAIDAGTVDLAVMRRTGRLTEPDAFWRDRMLWVGAADLSIPVSDPVPLVLPIAPNPVRDVVMEVLRAAGRTWRVTFEGMSLAGMEAALQAGFGFCIAPAGMRFHEVGPADPACSLPPLPDVEFVMIGPSADAPGPVQAFAALLREAARSSFHHATATSG